MSAVEAPPSCQPQAAQTRYWWQRVSEAAPALAAAERALVTRMLTNPKITADGLLILADALDEAARVAQLEGRGVLAEQLLRLADVPRCQAPILAGLGRP